MNFTQNFQHFDGCLSVLGQVISEILALKVRILLARTAWTCVSKLRRRCSWRNLFRSWRNHFTMFWHDMLKKCLAKCAKTIVTKFVDETFWHTRRSPCVPKVRRRIRDEVVFHDAFGTDGVPYALSVSWTHLWVTRRHAICLIWKLYYNDAKIYALNFSKTWQTQNIDFTICYPKGKLIIMI